MDFYEYFLLEANEYPDWKFGVEVEVAMEPMDASINRDGIVDTAIKGMRLGWKWKIDQTCIPGVEIVCSPQPIIQTSLNQLELDLNFFSNTCQQAGIKFVSKPENCATHIHIGGLNMDTKIKVADLWAKGVQDMGSALISPERQKLLDVNPRFTPTYMRRINSINQYQTLPHAIASTSAGKLVQKSLNWLKNTIAMDKYGNYDKFYSLSPRGGLGTLEFRTKESTLDGKEISILIRTIAAFAASADQLYTQGNVSKPQMRQALYQQGVSGKDLGYVMRKSNLNKPQQ